MRAYGKLMGYIGLWMLILFSFALAGIMGIIMNSLLKATYSFIFLIIFWIILVSWVLFRQRRKD